MSFDKLAAVYVFCMNYHEGQDSRKYRILSKINSQYNLWLTDNAIRQIEAEEPDEENEWLEANEMYNRLVKSEI